MPIKRLIGWFIYIQSASACKRHQWFIVAIQGSHIMSFHSCNPYLRRKQPWFCHPLCSISLSLPPSAIDIPRLRVLKQRGAMWTLCAIEFTPRSHPSCCHNPVHQLEDIWIHGSCFSLFWQEENI